MDEKISQFYTEYCHTKDAYIQYSKLIPNMNAQIQSISGINKGDKTFGIILTIAGLVTLPIFVGIIILALAVIYWILYFVSKNVNESKLRKIVKDTVQKKDELETYLKNEYSKTSQYISFLYASPLILERFIEYMQNGRADTLKEAINIYENEKVLLRQEEQLNNIASMSAVIANYSQISAYASTYLAADTFFKNII